METKKCNGCEDRARHSFEWEIIKELCAAKKRLCALLMAALILWFATVGCFVWYIAKNQTYTDYGRNAFNSDGEMMNGEEHQY